MKIKVNIQSMQKNKKKLTVGSNVIQIVSKISLICVLKAKLIKYFVLT